MGFTTLEANVASLFVRRRGADEEEFGSPEPVETQDSGVQLPQLFAWPSGDALILWSTHANMRLPFAATYDKATETWEAEQRLVELTNYYGAARFGASADSDGTLFAIWRTTNLGTLQYAVKRAGKPWGRQNPTSIRGDDMTALNLPAGGTFVTWSESGDGTMQLFGNVCR
jgi:hypothetical protein